MKIEVYVDEYHSFDIDVPKAKEEGFPNLIHSFMKHGESIFLDKKIGIHLTEPIEDIITLVRDDKKVKINPKDNLETIKKKISNLIDDGGQNVRKKI